MRQKYGYDVDPNLERFAIEIEDRIKEIKKVKRSDQNLAYILV